MRSFQLQRLGIVMTPEKDDPREIEGVLNPGAARGPDGQLYLFPRLVAHGNFSRIGIARVQFNGEGDPIGVQRLGIALEPQTDYELHPGGGGCEDPRISFVEPLQRYVMTYTAFGPKGPRIALASSKDLFLWDRLGLATFQACDGLECHARDFTEVNNKDALLFPKAIRGPDGEPSFAMIHRPFPGTDATKPCTIPSRERSMFPVRACGFRIPRATPWNAIGKTCDFRAHHRLACPVAPWEHLKIGGGPPRFLRHTVGWSSTMRFASQLTLARRHAGCATPPARSCSPRSARGLFATAQACRCLNRNCPKSEPVPWRTWSFQPPLTSGLTLVNRTVSMSTTGWQIRASAQRTRISPTNCHRKHGQLVT